MSKDNTQELNAIGARIRDVWRNERQDYEIRMNGVHSDWGDRYMARWDGGVTSTGRACDNVWLKIAKFCMKNSLQPEQLIRALFHTALGAAKDAAPKFPPMPNMAISPGAIACYDKYYSADNVTKREMVFKGEFTTQKAKAVTELDSLKSRYGFDSVTALKWLLADMDQPLTVLFRYCLAYSEELMQLADKYEASAINQYIYDKKQYDDVWGDWIPQIFKDKVASMQQLIGS